MNRTSVLGRIFVIFILISISIFYYTTVSAGKQKPKDGRKHNKKSSVKISETPVQPTMSQQPKKPKQITLSPEVQWLIEIIKAIQYENDLIVAALDEIEVTEEKTLEQCLIDICEKVTVVIMHEKVYCGGLLEQQYVKDLLKKIRAKQNEHFVEYQNKNRWYSDTILSPEKISLLVNEIKKFYKHIGLKMITESTSISNHCSYTMLLEVKNWYEHIVKSDTSLD